MADISMRSDTTSLPVELVQTPKLGSQQSKDDAKIEKAGRDFESILLGSWLQKAEQSFATVPGGDEDADADVGKDQFQGMAMQSLAGALTASGGIGIARMITDHLRLAAQKEAGSQVVPEKK